MCIARTGDSPLGSALSPRAVDALPFCELNRFAPSRASGGAGSGGRAPKVESIELRAYCSLVAELPSLVLLVRHGATEWSVTGQHTGRTDIPLTELGVAQAQAVRPVIERFIDGATPVVFSSPLKRARRTAELALPGLDATLTDSLLEVDYGQYEGLRPQEIAALNPNWNLFLDGCPGGEKPEQFAARCDAFRELVHQRAPGRPVVAFTHGHLSRVLAVRLLDFAPTAAAALYNDTASVGVISEHRGRWVLDGWNLK